ncbi:hypothetical protein WN943_029238 [Citrus x changshan-huyou]
MERRPVRREVYGRIYDITHRITNCMPVYADQVDGVGVLLWLTDCTKNGSLSNISELRFTSHTGTHTDALAMFLIIIMMLALMPMLLIWKFRTVIMFYPQHI